MASVITHSSEQVQRLLKVLQEDFGLPVRVLSVDVHVAMDESVKITCTYMPEKHDAE